MDKGQVWHDLTLPLPAGEFSPGWIDPYIPAFFGDQDGILPVEVISEDTERFAMAFYSTSDGGLTWTPRSLLEEVESARLYSTLVLRSSQDLYLACGNDLCVSHDGAQSWQRFSTNLNFGIVEAEPYVQTLDFTDPLTGWALVGTDRSQVILWQTTDGGEIWTILEPEFLED
jgi:photosystem II stability/assembly factor-like uncharacterized protein